MLYVILCSDGTSFIAQCNVGASLEAGRILQNHVIKPWSYCV